MHLDMDLKKNLRPIIGTALVIAGILFIVIGGKDIYQGFFSKGPQPKDPAVQEALAKSQELQEYEESHTHIRFLYPKSWNAKPIQNGTSFNALGDMINIRVSVDDFSDSKEEMTPERYRDLTRTQLESLEKEANMKYTVREEGTTTVANIPAYEWTYSLQVKDVSAAGSQVWLTKDKKVFVMTYTAPAQLFDTFYSIYQRMVESIKLP